jgi:hypothetical protein
MSIHLLIVAMIIIGVTTGVGAMVIARRTADTREQAISRQETIRYIGMALVAAALLTDAVGTPRHRWLDAVLLVLIAGGVAYDRFRVRKAGAAK